MVGGDPQQHAAEPSAHAEVRARLLAAFGKVAAEHGYDALSVEQVAGYAGVPRAVYEAHFETKEKGLVAAQEAFIERLWLDALNACEEEEEWPFRVRAGVAAVLASLAEASALARVYTVEARSASLVAAERQFAALDRFAALLRPGRRLYPTAASLPASTERALVGGIASIVSAHLLMENPQALPPLEEDLVVLVLIPYLGEAGARQVAAG